MLRMLDGAEVIKNIVIINVLMFLGSLVAQTAFNMNLNAFLGMFYFDSPLFAPYQVVTHMFMHGGFIHILFNMMMLVFLGTILERSWGAKRFLFFYLACGLGAALVHNASIAVQMYSNFGSIMVSDAVVNTNGLVASLYKIPVVGASGAIYGVFIAFALLFPNTEMYLLFFPFPIKAKYLVLIMIAFDLFGGFGHIGGSNIAHFAHLGGALFGFIIVKIWQKSRFRFY